MQRGHRWRHLFGNCGSLPRNSFFHIYWIYCLVCFSSIVSIRKLKRRNMMKLCFHFTYFFNIIIVLKNTFKNENNTVMLNLFHTNCTTNQRRFIRRFSDSTGRACKSNVPLQHILMAIRNSRVASDYKININIQ